MTPARRNWSRMFHRLWAIELVLCGAVAAVAYGYSLHLSRVDRESIDACHEAASQIRDNPRGKVDLYEKCRTDAMQLGQTRGRLRWAAGLAMTVPFVSLALGYALAWAIRGLQPAEPPGPSN